MLSVYHPRPYPHGAAARLQSLVDPVCPADGISFGRFDDKATWRLDAQEHATPEQIAAAQAIMAAFNPWEGIDELPATDPPPEAAPEPLGAGQAETGGDADVPDPSGGGSGGDDVLGVTEGGEANTDGATLDDSALPHHEVAPDEAEVQPLGAGGTGVMVNTLIDTTLATLAEQVQGEARIRLDQVKPRIQDAEAEYQRLFALGSLTKDSDTERMNELQGDLAALRDYENAVKENERALLGGLLDPRTDLSQFQPTMGWPVWMA